MSRLFMAATLYATIPVNKRRKPSDYTLTFCTDPYVVATILSLLRSLIELTDF
jgi:hypothetical protein